MTTPYIGFGNDELKNKPIVHAGDCFMCKKCGQLHELKGGTLTNGTPTEIILSYMCEGNLKLGAVDNHLVIDVTPSVSGTI